MNPLRLAVVGGRRGKAFNNALGALSGSVELVAVCDLREEVVTEWRAQQPQVTGYTDYERLLEDDRIDAVFLATPLQLHARQAIAALAAGKHVLSEVIAAHTMDDAWALIDAVESSGRVYMMAENYCFMRPNMMVRQMVDAGVFGELTYAEGAYIHEVRPLLHYPDGELTWRGELRRDFNGIFYPTHSLGPIGQWMRLGRDGGDRVSQVCAFVTGDQSQRRYFAERFGSEHPAAQGGWQGDSATAVLTTANGAVINLRVDCTSVRPHNMTHYALQGTTASYLSARHDREDPLVWIDGRSPGVSGGHYAGGAEPQWESLWVHADEYEHPLWRARGEQAQASGHGGGDYFVLADFAAAARGERPPAVDVYDAVLWSSMFPLSVQSVAAGSKPIDVPDFRSGRS